ncbi:YihY/virulence factor BrkB family protein [Parablastomonas sp. CN1-191]|uniref:YihY/virulence factor BrkB family protein n=1 Tax=Parablastomonas sp. CN1-191 TaxID=3400908 RepID=UPI003BF7DAE2
MEERPIATVRADKDAPALTVPDLSPEARRKDALRWRAGLKESVDEHIGPGTKARQIIARVWTGVYNDGFIHAGNLAYMAIIALFPFFIVGAAIFSLIGEPGQRAASINAILLALPPVVAKVIEPVALTVIDARSGWLLWAGGIVGLWTVGSLIETIRDILRRAYGTPATQAFWRYRLLSTGVILAAVVLLLAALIAQVLLAAFDSGLADRAPILSGLLHSLALSRYIPAVALYASLYLLFLSLTPSAYRKRTYPKWPGALFVAGWWTLVSLALPTLLSTVFKYDLTYGSLAGVMIALFFFWLVGLGMVVGAELNAALAETPEERDMIGQADNRARTTTKPAE